MHIIEKVVLFIKKLVKEKYYGILELRFEAGKIVHVRKSENFKPEDLINRYNL